MSCKNQTQTGETVEQTDNISVGVPMFSRDRALKQFLESVPEYVSEVLVADNGEQQDRAVYQDSWPFELTVLRMPFDCGIGKCRQAIVEACSDPYLWVGDSDMEFVDSEDLRRLRAILEADESLGGVSGWLIEGGTIRAGARNLDKHGSYAIKRAPDDPDVKQTPYPHISVEFIPQAGLFRAEIYEDYSYSPDVRSSEHFDFFWAHRDTKWEFASTPAVVTLHHRQINEEYRNSQHGDNHVDRDIIDEKWGVTDIVPGRNVDWAAVNDESLIEQGFDLFKRIAPPSLWVPAKRLGEGMLRD